MITIATPSGTVRAVPSEADATGSVRYSLTGAAAGTVHVTATSSPARWDQFDAVRASLGSASAVRELPVEPLVRIRGRAYQGSTVRVLAHSADVPWGWQGPVFLVDTDDRPAPEQASQTLTAVLRACASNYAARSDFARLQLAARRHDTPQLLKWLDAMISYAEQVQARYLEETEAHRVQAARSLAAWWTLGRWFTARPHPVLALLLAPDRESLAHRAEYLPKWAEISRGAAEDEGRRLTLFRSEYEGLARPTAAPENRDRRTSWSVSGRAAATSTSGTWRRPPPIRTNGPICATTTARTPTTRSGASKSSTRPARKPQPRRPAGRRARPASASTASSPARRPTRPLPEVAYRQAAPAPDHEERSPVATFAATPERCAQLGRALTAASVDWSDNGRQDDPQFLTHTATDPHGRMWQVSPATNFQISPSNPGQIWQASCAALMTRAPVLSARQAAEHIKDVPA
ncbi:hypothetical protein [Streptomyces mirabilis]|uniref:hypothetical protein n=1 Tax=Streptomyces mirabilis TaxID=68239 RepID=UPI0033E7F57B